MEHQEEPGFLSNAWSPAMGVHCGVSTLPGWGTPRACTRPELPAAARLPDGSARRESRGRAHSRARLVPHSMVLLGAMASASPEKGLWQHPQGRQVRHLVWAGWLNICLWSKQSPCSLKPATSPLGVYFLLVSLTCLTREECSFSKCKFTTCNAQHSTSL